jgi:hypothetical protein
MKLTVQNRISFEKETVEMLIKDFCRHHHESIHMCQECSSIEEYALERIKKCPLMPGKPVCSACHIHCYKPSMRKQIKAIMRYSGPRMIFINPIKAIIYLLIKNRLLTTRIDVTIF